MQRPEPCTLASSRVRLEPLTLLHAPGLRAAAADGALWNLRVTSVPEPADTEKYIETARQGLRDGHMLPFAVRELSSGQIVGCTRFHDISVAVDRLEIGYTWYAQSWQRSFVNTECKLLLAEDVPLEVLQSKDDKVTVPPLVGALLKNEQDVSLFEKLVFMQRNNR